MKRIALIAAIFASPASAETSPECVLAYDMLNELVAAQTGIAMAMAVQEPSGGTPEPMKSELFEVIDRLNDFNKPGMDRLFRLCPEAPED